MAVVALWQRNRVFCILEIAKTTIFTKFIPFRVYPKSGKDKGYAQLKNRASPIFETGEPNSGNGRAHFLKRAGPFLQNTFTRCEKY